MKSLILFVLLWMSYILLNIVSARSSVNNAEGTLVKQLLTDYDRDIKPTLDPDDPVNVTIKFFLSRIESLDEKTQVLSSFGFYIMTWTDEFLQWDPSTNGVYRFVISANRVWLPEIAAENSIEEGIDLSQDTKFRTQVSSDGTVFWGPSMKWKTYCEVDLRQFPNDIQKCTISFINWVYNEAGIKFLLEQTKVDTSLYLENGEWDLEDSYVFSYSRTLPDSAETFPAVGFTITLKRKPTYFVLNVIVPSIILSLSSLLVFMLPVESGEKVSLSITIMLSYSVLLLVVSDVTPRSGSGQPYLAYYMVANMGITALSLIVTVMVLSIFYHDPTKPLPPWLRLVTLNCLAYITRFTPENKIKGTTEVHPICNGTQPRSDDGHKDQVTFETKSPLPYAITEYFSRLAKKEAENSSVEDNKRDWERAAKIFDRFCLILASFVTSALILFLSISIESAQ